jgi:hypothetical protein
MNATTTNQPENELTLEHLIRRVPEGQETIFDLMAEGGERVRKIEISRRKLQPEAPVQMPEPEVARAKARSHVFHDVATFSRYINRESSAEDCSIVLADVQARQIVCVLHEDEDTDRESVSFAATDHPLFKPWLGMLNKPIDATEFALFCQKYRRTIIQPNGKELALVFSQIRMAKTVTVAQGVGKKALNGVMVEIEIAGQKQDSLIDLPDSITIKCPLFIGSEPLEIEIDLLVAEKNNQVVVYATAPDIEAKQVEAFESIVEKVREDSGLLVGLGQVKHRDWEVVPVKSYLG